MTKQQAGSTGGQWAQQQKEGLDRQQKPAAEAEARRVVEGGGADRQSQDQHIEGQQPAPTAREVSAAQPGDERTPDKIIGQVKYAGAPEKTQGGAGTPQTTPLEPEKAASAGRSAARSVPTV